LCQEKPKLDQYTTSLKAEGVEYTICDEVNQEPTVGFVDQLAKTLDFEPFDSILAVGGGSVIDVAKALAVIAQFGGQIRDYGGPDRVPEPLKRKIIAIPTTAGTGSEVSDGTVLIDEVVQSKFIVLSTLLCPTVAITDPELTTSMPPKITANSGVDALTHAIESYLSKDASVASELFSLRAVGLIGAGLKDAYTNGQDMDARETVQIGSTMAMIAGMNAHMGLVHAMIMPLCALYHIPHGQACGMVLPHALAYNASVVPGKVADIFKAMGILEKTESPDALDSTCYRRLDRFLEDVGIPAKLNDFGFRDDHMPTIVQETFNSIQCQFNPQTPSKQDIVNIVKQLL
jgi:alcohol dehydrogenase class IV